MKVSTGNELTLSPTYNQNLEGSISIQNELKNHYIAYKVLISNHR